MNNLIAFFEIPTVDFYRAINFYETILGLKLSVFECETEKMACFIEQGEVVGALFYAPSYQPSPDGILIHFNSQDIEDTAKNYIISSTQELRWIRSALRPFVYWRFACLCSLLIIPCICWIM